MFERLGRLLGERIWARVSIVLLTSALFGIAHYPVQGIPGLQQATITGLTFGTIYAITRRLPLLMIAHAAFDVTAVAIIYWDLETAVAHWIFT
jgi:membrane protease YdiL (CAAX protease family)